MYNDDEIYFLISLRTYVSDVLIHNLIHALYQLYSFSGFTKPWIMVRVYVTHLCVFEKPGPGLEQVLYFNLAQARVTKRTPVRK